LLIHEITGHDNSDLRPNTTVNFDLGIYGYDADEFIKSYLSILPIDMTEYRHCKYFTNESVFALSLSLFRRRTNAHYIPLTIDDLVANAIRGKWQ
jgi:hypothetical protein